MALRSQLRHARWILPLCGTVLCYGLAQGLYKQVPLTAGQFCLLFVAVKTPVNWGAWGAFSRRRLTDPESRPFLFYALLGQVVNGLAWICYFLALDRGPAAVVGTVTAAYTAVTVLLAMVFLRERLAPRQVLGVALVIGAGMVLGYAAGGAPATEAGRVGWLTLSFATMGLWGVAVCIFKHAYNQEHADDYRFFLTNWAGMVLTLLPYGWLSAGGAASTWSPGVVGLGLLIVLLYALGDLLLFAAIQRGPASVVSPLSGLYPIPTLVYAALVLHERLGGLQWGAVALVLLALLLLVPAPAEPHHDPEESS